MQKVNIDLIPGEVNAIVYASQNDDGRTIRFELFLDDIGGTYTLDGNETIVAKITKPDGTAITIPITNPGVGKHYVDLVNGTTDYDQDGVYIGEISFTDGDETIGSGNFVLKVEADPYDGSVQKKIVIDNPATFSTTLPDVLVSCKCKIDDANGIDSMDVINAGPTYAMNSVPYQLRQTPITANRCLEKLVGVSCAFNQLVQNGNFADTSGWINIFSTLSASNNEMTITSTQDNVVVGISQYIPFVLGRNYLIRFDAKSSDVPNIRIRQPHQTDTQALTSTYTTFSFIVNADDIGTNWLYIQGIKSNLGDAGTINLKNVNVIDLTACFGSEVADFLYNLENS